MLARLCFLAALLGSTAGLRENTTTLQDVNEVIILTKKIAPFSSPTDMVNQRGSDELPTSGAIEAEGFSIDLIVGLVSKLVQPDTTITIHNMAGGNTEILEGENGILSDRCNPDFHPSRLCIGAAGISITASRERKVDFLVSFFTSGLRVMTRLEAKPQELIGQIVVDVLTLLYIVVVISLLVLLLITPGVWALEMSVVRQDRVPIFQPSAYSGKDAHGKPVVRNSFWLLFHSFFNAFQWTLTMFGNATLQKPRSKIAQKLVVPLLGLLRMGVKVIVTAATAAIFTIDASRASAVTGLKDLGPAHRVCVNTDSGVNTAFVRDRQSTIGYQVVERESYQSMLDSYWAGKCEAVVYDDAALQYEITAAGQDGTHGLVGDRLSFDPYGFALPPSHPLFDAINIPLIDEVRDNDVMEPLRERWMSYQGAEGVIGQPSGLESIDAWSDVLLIIGLLALALIVVSFAYVGLTNLTQVKDIVEIARRSQAGDAFKKKVQKNLDEAIYQGEATLALTDESEIVHDMARQIQGIEHMMYLLFQEFEGRELKRRASGDGEASIRVGVDGPEGGPSAAAAASSAPQRTSVSSAPPQVVGQPTADRTHVQVVVPAGVGPGIAFMVNTPSGQMQVTCPQGVSAGMPMMVNVAQSV